MQQGDANSEVEAPTVTWTWAVRMNARYIQVGALIRERVVHSQVASLQWSSKVSNQS